MINPTKLPEEENEWTEPNLTLSERVSRWFRNRLYELSQLRKRSFIAIAKFLIMCASALWRFITIPVKIFEAIFYAHKLDSKGNIISSKFSLIKMIFSLASFIMLFKLFVGGAAFEDVKFGPEVEVDKKIITIKVPVKKTRKRKSRGRRARRRRRRTTTSKRVSIVATIKAKVKTKTKTVYIHRPFFYIKKYTGSPLTMTEILLYLVIAMLFYFRDDFSQGDQRGVFGTLVDMLIQAKAIQMAGTNFVNPQQTGTGVDPTLPDRSDAIIPSAGMATEPLLEPKDAPDIPEPTSTAGRRRKRRGGNGTTKDNDPFA